MTEQLDLFAAPPAPRALPPDQADRNLVTNDLHTTLFVEAGAGSGKTTALVGRVVNLVLSGVPVGEIAAITFTEKAAAELRHKVRAELEKSHTPLADAALAELDLAPIGTLHAFARRLLGEFPIEAQLPPRFAVLDEVQSSTAFQERFTDFLESLLDDIASVRLVELCQYDKFDVEKGVRRMADDFQANWDLVEERVVATPPPPADDDAWRARLATACQAVAAYTAPPGCTQEPVIAAFAQYADVLSAVTPLGEFLRLATEIAATRNKGGNKQVWKKFHGSETVLDEYREALGEAAAMARAALAACNEERRLTLGALLREFTLTSVQARRAEGTLEFHDLLVLARRLLRDHQGVRRALHARYTHLLLDEFQDTDPIQLELAVRITAAPDDQPADWTQLQPLPGRLTVVGDPKQSIYRFRRADIAQFLRAREQIGARRATLSANFRSTAPVIEWVNHTMANLIVAQPDVQPEYQPLTAARHSGHDHGTVTVLGLDAHTDLGTAAAEALREREAADVAATVVTTLADGWPVWRERDDGGGGLEPCRAGDIAILLPSRLSLAPLQAALSAAGVAYRAENSSLVYAAPEVRALMLALRAADDPTDELAIVSALRTPLFGCSDRDLYDWRRVQGQHWNIHQVPEALGDHPVGQALACLGEVNRRIPFSTPSELLGWLIRERGVIELALAGRDSRDVWRRVRFVVDQARAWSESGGHGVRRYLLWTRLQGDDGRFVAETVLPETDHDAVRIMTIHAAKGLEFPITIVSGLTGKANRTGGKRVIWPPSGWGLSEADDPTYQQFAPVDEAMSDAERNRLLYVACTRAMDHLVVSCHRGSTGNGSAACVLAAASAGAEHRSLTPTTSPLVATAEAGSQLEWAQEDVWAQTWAQDRERASRPAALGATSLAARLQAGADAATAKDAVDLDLPPWQRGRYGTAVGRAVHAVLQFADLTDGHDIPALAAAQASAEGVFGHERTIERLARSALEAPMVAAGARGEHWRELFVAAQVGDTVVEGYVDLLVRHPEHGLVIVDYKTDQVPPGPDRDDRLRRYGHQLAAYGVALETLLGTPIQGGVLVMCSAKGPAEEVPIAGWAALQQAVRAELDQNL